MCKSFKRHGQSTKNGREIGFIALVGFVQREMTLANVKKAFAEPPNSSSVWTKLVMLVSQVSSGFIGPTLYKS